MMVLKEWEDLPLFMQTDEVKKYYDILVKRKKSLVIKRIFDIIVSLIMLFLLSPAFLIIAILIKRDSQGPVFFRQIRVTQYGRKFKIYKFRTMINNAEKNGTQVTISGDARVTKVGSKLRGSRLDEIPQLLNILKGDMSFVGTRPEVPKYVEQYTAEMNATLLLPAGVTSEASIQYKNENSLLEKTGDIDAIYIYNVLPQKMYYNLRQMKCFGFWKDIGVMFQTIRAVCRNCNS